jgi:hypothetical protein
MLNRASGILIQIYTDIITFLTDSMKSQGIVVMAAAMLTLLITTVVTFGVTPSYAQVVDNEGIDEDEDTTNIGNTPTKIKESIICNTAGFVDICEQRLEAGIGIGEGESPHHLILSS